MKNITTQFSDIQLTEFGRAMERSGFTDLASFICWAAQQQTAAILNEK